jgi:hypothetical protein
VHREPGRVDDAIGVLAQVREEPTLRLDAVEDVALSGQRVTASRLVIAPHERLVGGLEKQHLRAMPPRPQLFERVHQMREILPFPDVDAEGDLADAAARLRAELGKGRDQRGGEIVDAEVAQVLEALDRIALARTREPRDDDEADRVRGQQAALDGIRGDHATGSINSKPPSPRR